MTTRPLGRLAAFAALALAAGVASASVAQEQNPGPPEGGGHWGGHGGGPREACMADIKTFCAGVERGGGRIMQCLRDHHDQLSDGCKSALASARFEHRHHDEATPPANPSPPSN